MQLRSSQIKIAIREPLSLEKSMGRRFFVFSNDTIDHVGIVESCDGKRIYTIEGNTGNMCKRRSYPVGWYEIYGYGVIMSTKNNENNKVEYN